jgi:hypothetical protein
MHIILLPGAATERMSTGTLLSYLIISGAAADGMVGGQDGAGHDHDIDVVHIDGEDFVPQEELTVAKHRA